MHLKLPSLMPLLLPAAQQRQWAEEGHCTVQLVDRDAWRAAAAVAPAVPPGGAVFPFAQSQFSNVQSAAAREGGGGDEAVTALSLLSFDDRLRLAAEQLLCDGQAGGLRLIHSSVERVASDSERAGTPGAVDSHVALTLAPSGVSTTAAEAVDVLIPLDGEGASVLFCRFDPLGQYPAASAAAAALRAQHTTVQRVLLRVAAAEHIQCDSYGRDGGPGWLFRALTPEQRTLLGFPLPGHKYWTHGTASAVASRYALDGGPYLDALTATTPDPAAVAKAERYIFGGPEGRPTGTAKPAEWPLLSPPVWYTPDRALGGYSPGPQASNGDDDASVSVGAVLSAEMISQWHEHGFLVLDDLWPASTISAAAAAASDMYPADEPGPGGHGSATGAAREGRAFPFSRQPLNDVVLHPRVLKAVSQLLARGADDEDPRVRYYGGGLTLKLGTEPLSGDQGMHLDFGTETLLFAPRSVKKIHHDLPRQARDKRQEEVELNESRRFCRQQHVACTARPTRDSGNHPKLLAGCPPE
jgi:hypothetical protein